MSGFAKSSASASKSSSKTSGKSPKIRRTRQFASGSAGIGKTYGIFAALAATQSDQFPQVLRPSRRKERIYYPLPPCMPSVAKGANQIGNAEIKRLAFAQFGRLEEAEAFRESLSRSGHYASAR